MVLGKDTTKTNVSPKYFSSSCIADADEIIERVLDMFQSARLNNVGSNALQLPKLICAERMQCMCRGERK